MLNAADRKRLAALLGMLGSNQSGERDNAARLAEQFRRKHGVTWAELLDGAGSRDPGSRNSALEAEVRRLKGEVERLNRDVAVKTALNRDNAAAIAKLEQELRAWKHRAAAENQTRTSEAEETAILERLRAIQRSRGHYREQQDKTY